MQTPLIPHQRAGFGAVQRELHLTLLRQRSDAAPGAVDKILKRDSAVTGTVLRQAILQPGELQQILNHQLQPLQLPLKALHQHGVVPSRPPSRDDRSPASEL